MQKIHYYKITDANGILTGLRSGSRGKDEEEIMPTEFAMLKNLLCVISSDSSEIADNLLEGGAL